MSCNKQRSVLAFCHIPKTAGSSLNLLLRRHFGSRVISATPRPGAAREIYQFENMKQDLDWFPKTECFSGHFIRPFINFHEFDNQIKWFTFLRSPAKRFISHFIHQQTNGRHPKMNINEWANRLDRANLQVKWIAGEMDLEAAKQILNEKFAFVGCVENFDTEVQRMLTELKIPKFSTRLKAKKMVVRDPWLKQEVLDKYDHFKDTIEENNFLDQELYDHFSKHCWNKRPDSIESKHFSANLPNAHTGSILANLKHKTRLCQFQLNDKLIYRTRLKLTRVK